MDTKTAAALRDAITFYHDSIEKQTYSDDITMAMYAVGYQTALTDLQRVIDVMEAKKTA